MMEQITRIIGDSLSHISPFSVLLVITGGLVSSIGPCILALIPLLVGFIGGQSDLTRARGFLLSLAFTAGVSLDFAILGIISVYFGGVFGQLGITGRIWSYIIACICVLMGLQLLEVLHVPLPTTSKIFPRQRGVLGAFLLGVSFGLIASPCGTPILVVLLAHISSTHAHPLWGGLLLFLYGLGYCLPVLLAGTFTGILKSLKHLSAAGSVINKSAGALLILVGLYILYYAR
ncbi:MAG: cytochrome c biogenesis protein CcdA [Armatimonadetes bacterium]|nr:cytochrome c biogenesis protein CcdA [Armatimonadota bacterium]